MQGPGVEPALPDPKLSALSTTPTVPHESCSFKTLSYKRNLDFFYLQRLGNLQGNSLIGYPVGPFGPTYYYTVIP